MPLIHDEKISLATKSVSYMVTPDDETREAFKLGGIRFTAEAVGGSAFRLCEYFTPEQADEMAAAFTEVARRARVANGIEVEATPAEVAEFERKLTAAKFAAVGDIHLVTVDGRDDGNYAFRHLVDANRFRDAAIAAGADPVDVNVDCLPLCNGALTGELVTAELAS